MSQKAVDTEYLHTHQYCESCDEARNLCTAPRESGGQWEFCFRCGEVMYAGSGEGTVDEATPAGYAVYCSDCGAGDHPWHAWNQIRNDF